MPMSWTAENDRLLLLKLIETHGISVNPKIIAEAWPDEGPKPTARAITERFVVLRKLAGLKVSVGSGGTSGKTRTPRASKYTTPKKRKTKHGSDESDAEKYLTDEDTPTKKSTPRSGGGSARGRGGRGGARGGWATAIKIEDTLVDLLDDPFDANFAKDAAEAADIRQTSEKSPFEFILSNGMNRNFQGFTPINGNPTLAGFGPGRSDLFDNGFAASGPVLIDDMPADGTQFHGFANNMQDSVIGFGNGDNGQDVSRAPSARKASAQATEGVANLLMHQKNEDEVLGERSSGEDSQASEYHDLEEDYV